MKDITEKANKLKELESLKEAKNIQEEQLATSKKYDEMVEISKPNQEITLKVEEETKPKEEFLLVLFQPK